MPNPRGFNSLRGKVYKRKSIQLNIRLLLLHTAYTYTLAWVRFSPKALEYVAIFATAWPRLDPKIIFPPDCCTDWPNCFYIPLNPLWYGGSVYCDMHLYKIDILELAYLCFISTLSIVLCIEITVEQIEHSLLL